MNDKERFWWSFEKVKKIAAKHACGSRVKSS